MYGSPSAINIPTPTSLILAHHINSGNKSFVGKIANFRLFSKALNAEQVKELYDYQKDYFLGSRSSLTIHKGNLGLGVAEPTSRLEIAGNERIQEYPPRAMTGHDTYMEEHGVFRARWANWYSGNTPTGMYNKTMGGGQENVWYGPYNGQMNGNGTAYNGGDVYSGTDFAASTTSGFYLDDVNGNRYHGAWTTLEMPYDILLQRIHLYQGASSEGISSRCITEDGVILGSANGHEWHHVHTFTGLQYGGTLGSYSFDAAGESVTVNATTPYKHYALVTTRTLHYAFTVIIGELKWFGTPAPSTLDDGHLTLGKQLTTPRVSGHAAGAETPRAESLVVHYDTTVDSVVTGTTVVDTSGNGINSAMENGLVYSSNERALVFDGTDDRTYISSVKNGSGAWVHSISLWCKSNSAANDDTDTFAFIGEKSSYKCIGLETQTNGNIRYYFWASDGDTPTGSFTRGVWHHVAVTYDGGSSTTSKSVYIDGVKQTLTQSGGTTALNLNANDEFLLGCQQGGTKPLNGSISNFKLWNVALTADDVAAEYALGRTGKALNVTDTAVCLGGTVPRAKFDVRGIATVDRLNIVERLDVNTIARLNHYAGSRSGTFSGSGTFDLPANLDYGYAAAPQIGWEIHMAFGFSGTAGGEFFITGAKDTSGTNVSANEHSHFSIEPNGSTNYGGTCYLTYSGEPVAPVYYAKITIAQPYFNNVPASSNGSVNRIHMMYDCVGCKRMTGASIFRGACYFSFSSSGRRIKYLRLNCTAGTVSGNYMVNALTSEL
jgi:hypothetical protein